MPNVPFDPYIHIVYLPQVGSGVIEDRFRGIRYQRGGSLGSLLGGLFRAVLPAAKSLGVRAAKSVGRELLKTSADVAQDVLSGENIGQSLKARSKQAGKRLLRKAAKKLSTMQSGKGFGIQPKRKKNIIPIRRARKSKRRTRPSKRLRITDAFGSYFA